MPNESDRTKPRPVDALFGESSVPSATSYIVEPPQPPTTVSPPPPERIAAPLPTSAPAAAPLPAVAAPAKATPGRRAPAFDAEPVVSPPAAAPQDRIAQMYEQAKAQSANSRLVANECMALLRQAREAHTKQDFASAEFYVESADARLKRSARSEQASRRPVVWLIWLWNLAMLAAGMLSVAVTYILNLTLFGLEVAPEAIVLMRAVSWGVIGGVLGALVSVMWAIRRREYDPANDIGYFARPLIGALLGGVLFVLSQAGIVAGNVVIGTVKAGPLFLYVFAALVGFGQDTVLESLRDFLKTIFRVQKT
ncbi:MAG: hypothetical protein KGJ80_04305 [Chloroflexota bacterium]|nr:hypothetical protein [Chloroflexota bacterium]